MKKKILKIIGVIFIIFLLWRIAILLGIGSGNSSREFEQPPVAIEVDTVAYAPIKEIREFTGTVYPIYHYVVSPKVSGRIIEINKRIGDWVKKGEVIARIDDAEYQQAVLEAEANLKIAEASYTETRSQLELVKQELERIQSLQKKGIASPSELDAALTNYDAQQSRLELTKAQVDQREAALKSSRIRLSYTVLSATEPGFIGERFVDEGSLLAPNAAVVSVIGIDTVIIRTTVIERDYGRLQVGQDTEVEVDAYPSKRFHGKVSRIAPMLQEASRVAQMEVEVANESLLIKPGMFSRVKVVLTEKVSTQVVPSESVIRRNGENGVFVVDAGEKVAHYFPVEVGIISAQTTEIISPKLDGYVVTLGQHLLDDGSAVILPEKQDQVSADQTGSGDKEPVR